MIVKLWMIERRVPVQHSFLKIIKGGIKKQMIQITREQALEIRGKLRNEYVKICNRQGPSKKKSYYVAETYPVVRLLKDMESKKKVTHFE